MTVRIIGFTVTLVSILILPYWIYFPMLLVGILLFPFFWEGILLAFLVDIVYGSGIETALIASVLSIILLPIKDNLRFYV